VCRPGWSPIVELRQYVLRPGQRDVLIELFDAKLLEPQEEVGMKLIGQFRDLERPDNFVWLRGFPDMSARARSLAAFYGGPVWKAHREAANATIVDSDDVLLLRPARGDSAFVLDRDRRPRGGFVAAVVMQLDAPADQEIVSSFEVSIALSVAQSGGSILGYFVTEASENTFPGLPVREGEYVFAWFAGFADRDGLERATELQAERAQVLHLAPTSRSALP
jgi:hypothetical protein